MNLGNLKRYLVDPVNAGYSIHYLLHLSRQSKKSSPKGTGHYAKTTAGELLI